MVLSRQQLSFFLLLYLGASLYFLTWMGLRDQVSLYSRMVWFLLLVPSLWIISQDIKGYTRFVLANKWLLLIIAWFALTAIWSPLPFYTIKRVIFYSIALVSLSALTYGADSIKTFHRQLVWVSIIFLLLCVASYPLTPEQSVTYLGFAGIFDHKNTAGQWGFIMFFVLMFADLRNRVMPAIVLRLLLLAAVAAFLIASQSKTSLALVYVLSVVYFILLYFWSKSQPVRWLFNIALLGMLLLFLTYYHYSGFTLANYVYDNFGTFTGRDKLWNAARVFIDKHYWLGYGYGAFWDLDHHPEPIQELYGFWRYIYINQFHNGFVELRVQTGMVGMLLLCAYIMRSLYLCYYLLSRPDPVKNHQRSEGMVFLVLLGIIFNNLTESTFFMPSHFLGVVFVWFSLWLERLVRERKAALAQAKPAVNAEAV